MTARALRGAGENVPSNWNAGAVDVFSLGHFCSYREKAHASEIYDGRCRRFCFACDRCVRAKSFQQRYTKLAAGGIELDAFAIDLLPIDSLTFDGLPIERLVSG